MMVFGYFAALNPTPALVDETIHMGFNKVILGVQ